VDAADASQRSAETLNNQKFIFKERFWGTGKILIADFVGSRPCRNSPSECTPGAPADASQRRAETLNNQKSTFKERFWGTGKILIADLVGNSHSECTPVTAANRFNCFVNSEKAAVFPGNFSGATRRKQRAAIVHFRIYVKEYQ
jgi:hypothetical protein